MAKFYNAKVDETPPSSSLAAEISALKALQKNKVLTPQNKFKTPNSQVALSQSVSKHNSGSKLGNLLNTMQKQSTINNDGLSREESSQALDSDENEYGEETEINGNNFSRYDIVELTNTKGVNSSVSRDSMSTPMNSLGNHAL